MSKKVKIKLTSHSTVQPRIETIKSIKFSSVFFFAVFHQGRYLKSESSILTEKVTSTKIKGLSMTPVSLNAKLGKRLSRRTYRSVSIPE